MNARPLISLGVMAAGLSACVATQPSGPVGPGAGASAQSGSFTLTHAGADYPAQVMPGPAGHALTRAGAAPVMGQTVRVGALRFDQGRLAKDVAAGACAQAKGRFQPQAVSRFEAGAWIFEGACA
ncbi:hypothetical protein [Gemmobacter serpentinus]|uniref:hypothetical protein n=1 Tax=Gemmobacter serpentinus TaxID=2652247 RepID=UPI00124E4C6A|nr:hypothetical protein [Gemmobacter serpentinus]